MVSTRSVPEVLKWACVPDLCTHLCLVSSLWLKAAASDEVWDCLSEAYCYDSIHPGETVKSAFRRQLQERVVYRLTGEWLFGYDVRKSKWKSPVSVKSDCYCFGQLSSLVLFQAYLVATGSVLPSLGQSALIHIETGHIIPLPGLLHPRYSYGSLLYRGSVYAFAGVDAAYRNTDFTEKLNLYSRKQWVALPALLCEMAFSSPCRKGDFAYLFGGWGTNICQKYDLDREIVHLLPFTTPQFDYLTTAFVYENALFFIQSGNMGSWQGTEETAPVIFPFEERTNSNWWGQMQGICVNGQFYILTLEPRLIRVDIETLGMEELKVEREIEN